MKDPNAPYSLFQADNGLWGCKDRNGRVVLAAEYQKLTGSDGRTVYASRDCLAILDFSKEDGFEILAWFSEPDPWGDDK